MSVLAFDSAPPRDYPRGLDQNAGEALSAAGYYCRFAPEYSDATNPLTDLTKSEC